MFKALVITKPESGYRCELTELDEAQLPASGDVTVRVDYSTVNYKDGLAITGKSPVVRSFPMVPGIDFAGSVTQSDHPKWKAGDRVLLNGFGVGENHWGGLSQMARVKGDWLVALPDTLSERDAMAVGTAGYTAMLCVMALQRHWADAGVAPGSGEVLVTGANGGVGSVAISLLAGLGHTVVASTGRPQEADYLKSLGAASVIDRNELGAPGKPLQKERWAGVVDAVGISLADCQTIRQHFDDITINDIFMAATGGAIRKYLERKGELPARTLNAMVPMSTRGGNKAMDAGNQFGMAPMALRTDIADPVRRLRAIRSTGRNMPTSASGCPAIS